MYNCEVLEYGHSVIMVIKDTVSFSLCAMTKESTDTVLLLFFFIVTSISLRIVGNFPSPNLVKSAPEADSLDQYNCTWHLCVCHYVIRSDESVMCLHACRHTSAGVFVHSDEAWQTVTAMAAGQVDTHRVGLAVMHLGRTFINIWGQTSRYSGLISLTVLWRHSQDTQSDSSGDWWSRWMTLIELRNIVALISLQIQLLWMSSCCLQLSIRVLLIQKWSQKLPSLINYTDKQGNFVKG